MLNSKPFVQVACVCEKVLIEPDSVASLIRIVDTYFMNPIEGLPPDIGIKTDLSVFISLKSGDLVGEFQIGMRLRGPDGAPAKTLTWPVAFNGGEHGVNAKIALTLLGQKFGLYWFDVLWGDELLTSIPFQLKPISVEQSEAAPSESAKP